ncbi:7230_t:CDS:2 [Ambispora leptoticha]|uniref:7230_t:CDS:1 n=1 Tax=Ambispora leptoticha TaxID=144679 RepID=A0A9N9C3X9_9GLOM|nr:7230_t:CDS:2 [Ambispora leptoticha]
MGSCLDKPRENETNAEIRSIVPFTATSSIEKRHTISLNSEPSLNNHNDNYSHNKRQKKNSWIFSINADNRFAKLHALFKYTWQVNFLAPVHEQLESGNARVLDYGCQTGEWVLDISVKYPLAKVWGIDTSNIFPSSPIPLNSNFLHFDILNGFPFADNTFDLVHARCLAFTFTKIEWEHRVIKELLRVLKPGTGWLSLLEINLFYTNEGPNTAKLTESMRSFLKGKNMDPDITSLQLNLLHESNQCTDIQVHERFPTPGNYIDFVRVEDIIAKEFALTMYGLRTELSNFMGLNNEEYNSLIESSVKEFKIYKTSVRQTNIIARRI